MQGHVAYPGRDAEPQATPRPNSGTFHAVVIGPLGGELAAKGFDFEATRWVSIFEGEYRRAKGIIARLDSEQVPNRLTFPDDAEPGTTAVVVQVMKKWEKRARQLIAESTRNGADPSN